MLRVGILGAGFMGGTHAAAFAQLPDVQIVGVSSRSAEKAGALAAKYGAKPFSAALELATDPRVEVISNTLPTQLHNDLTIAALKAGKHVLTAFFTGQGPHERDYRRGATLEFEKSPGAKLIELQIRDLQAKLQPEFQVKVWP